MPLVRISIPAGKGEAFAKSVSEGVHDAMVVTIDIPQADRFQVITEHAAGRLVIDPAYMDIERSEDAVIIQITMRSGRTVAKKRALYRAIADNLVARTVLRKEDIMIVLTENELIDWSFGNGEAQYVPE